MTRTGLHVRPRRRRFVAAMLALAVALVAGGVAIAAGRDDGHGIHKKMFLTFIDVTVEEAFVDAEPKAEGEDDISPGDAFFFRDELWNRAETKKVGEIQGMCTFLFHFTAHCEATAFLRRGTIELEGGIRFEEEGPGVFFVAVTGGTQEYENVVGEAKLTEIEGTNKSRIRFELIPSFKRP